jgi:hypothetical protein
VDASEPGWVVASPVASPVVPAAAPAALSPAAWPVPVHGRSAPGSVPELPGIVGGYSYGCVLDDVGCAVGSVYVGGG